MTLYAVGDVQGCARTFKRLLKRISFDPDRDRLWLVGDLVNRGPASRKVLRKVIKLGDSVTCVLGNHDLHLLATAAGVRRRSRTDTFHDILDADDAADLIDWLRRRPLLHLETKQRRALVHAGIYPAWQPKEAKRYAQEVEARLSGPGWRRSLARIYGSTPDLWSPKLVGADRRRFTINALTRMRFCDASGRLDFGESGPPGSQPRRLTPWFRMPERPGRKWHIVFGHWSTLGLYRRDGVTATDTGCVWGGKLTAVPLDRKGAPIAVSYAER